MSGCFFAYRIENGYGLRYNEFDESEPEKKTEKKKKTESGSVFMVYEDAAKR